METSEHGVVVKIDAAVYLVPWANVQTVRFEDETRDAAPPFDPGPVDTRPLGAALEVAGDRAIAKLNAAFDTEAAKQKKGRSK